MSFDPEIVLASFGPAAPHEAARFLVAADYFLSQNQPELAASALDRAYGLAPFDVDCVRQRKLVLDSLAVVDHGMTFRYVPGGTFLMGSTTGDPDERPAHPRRVNGCWISEVPVTWAAYCDLMDWEPPPGARPKDGAASERDRQAAFDLFNDNKIRMQYCGTHRAKDWHEHAENFDVSVTGMWGVKPMVAVAFYEAESLVERLGPEYGLPTEVEWEKAARGGLIDCRYPWGNEPPTAARCDFNHFGEFLLKDPRSFPANGYGLFGMCGGVNEWTDTSYDALDYYNNAKATKAEPAPQPEEPTRVLRGGSWSDCADAVTVSFRMSLPIEVAPSTPNVGFRLVRRALRKLT